MAIDRKDRIDDSRNLHTRDAETRRSEIIRKLSQPFNDLLDVGSYPIPAGVKYYWGRKTLLGETDHERLPELFQKGYERVPADRHPDLIDPESKSNYIQKKGLVLLERINEYNEIEE